MTTVRPRTIAPETLVASYPPFDLISKRVSVVGCERFDDYDLLARHMDTILSELKAVTIVSGDYVGTDLLAKMYATDQGYEQVEFTLNKHNYGDRADAILIRQIIANSNVMVMFVSDMSEYMKDVQWHAQRARVKVIVVYI